MKTYDNAVSVDGTGRPPDPARAGQEERAATGDISTSEIQDATPAVQVRHISARGPATARWHLDDLPARQPRRTAGRVDQRAAPRHPPRRHPRRWLDDVRRGRQGRHVGGQDARAAGQGTAATTTSPTRTRLAGVTHGRPGQAAPRPVRPGQHAGEVRAVPRHRQRRATAGGAACQPEPTFSQVPPTLRHDHEVHRPALEEQAARRRASSSRSRAPRSTRRTTRPTPAARSVRPSSSTRPSRRRWPSPRRTATRSSS